MSRLDSFKQQNPQLNISLIDIIASLDPTSTYKYTQFFIKSLKNELESDDIKKEIGEMLFEKEFVNYINRFEKHCIEKRIKNNDISRYNHISEIVDAVKLGDEILKQKESEKQVIKLYDKDGYLVLIPLTYDSAKTYGANTEWCITQKKYWDQYQWNYRIIYIIDKNNNNKCAISRKYNDIADIKGWTKNDKEISPLLFSLPEELIFFALKEIRKPQFEIELSVLGDNNIYKEDGLIIPIEDSTNEQMGWFIQRFDAFLPENLKFKLKTDDKKNKNAIYDLIKNSEVVTTTTISNPQSHQTFDDIIDPNSLGDIQDRVLEIMSRLYH